MNKLNLAQRWAALLLSLSCNAWAVDVIHGPGSEQKNERLSGKDKTFQLVFSAAKHQTGEEILKGLSGVQDAVTALYVKGSGSRFAVHAFTFEDGPLEKKIAAVHAQIGDAEALLAKLKGRVQTEKPSWTFCAVEFHASTQEAESAKRRFGSAVDHMEVMLTKAIVMPTCSE